MTTAEEAPLSNPTIFVQYRYDMLPSDRAFITVQHGGNHPEGVNYHINARIDGALGDDSQLRPLSETILTYEALEIIRNVVPLYIKQGETFYTLARGMDHRLHRPLDFEQVQGLAEQLGLPLKGIRIVECIIAPAKEAGDPDAPASPDECRRNVQQAATYFCEFL